MNVREFKLVNESGQEFSLMDIENYCLLTDPSGLGYEYSAEYEQLGNTFISNLRKIQLEPIRGQVNFLKYDNYRKLVDFIEKSETLKFAYKVPYKDIGTVEFYKDIEIKSLSKTQIQTNNIISETIVFNCLSLWYKESKIFFTTEEAEDEIRWDFTWDSRFVDNDSRNLEIVNDGHTEASVVIEIDGEVVKPKIELYVEGELYQTIEFNTTIDEYEKLLYCSKENEFYMNKQTSGGSIVSLMDLSIIDFESDLVIRLPRNKLCKIVLSGTNDIGVAKVVVYSYYKAV